MAWVVGILVMCAIVVGISTLITKNPNNPAAKEAEHVAEEVIEKEFGIAPSVIENAIDCISADKETPPA